MNLEIQQKKEKGITLIALVVTIIILLILAGVTIATLTGDNGILTKANEAKKSTEIENEKEKIVIAVISTGYKNNSFTTNELEESLKKEFLNDYGVLSGDGDWDYIGKYGSYHITRDGKVTQILNYKIYGNNESILPDEYQQVEYIEGNGGQYIDTELKATVFPLKVEYEAGRSDLSKPSCYNGNLFPYVAAQKYGDYTRFYSFISDKGDKKLLNFTFQPEGSSSLYNGFHNIDDNLQISGFIKISHEITEKYTHLFVGKNEYYTEYEQSQYKGDENITIFRLVNHMYYYSNGKMKYFKAYINDNLNINLVPCYYKLDGEIGMYDLVSNRFFKNKGSGEFLKGKDKDLYVGNKNENNEYDIPLKIVTRKGEKNINITLNQPLKKNKDVADYIDLKNKKVIRYIEEDGNILDNPIEEEIKADDIPEIKDIISIDVETNVSSSKIDIQ